MTGMNKHTGRKITGLDHMRQSCNDILATPIGSVVMNRDYGSLLPELIDHPANGSNVLRMMMATVMALHRWEPRISISQVGITIGDLQGQVIVDLEGMQNDLSGRSSALSLNVPIGGLR